MENEAQNEVEKRGRKCEGGAQFASRAFGFGADFVGDEAAEGGEEDASKKNSKNPEIKVGEPVEGETAGGDGPEEFYAGGLAEIQE